MAIGPINISRAFPCPNCGKLICESKISRVLGYISMYVPSTIVVFYSKLPILFRIPLWFVLGFVFGFIYIFLAKRLFILRLVEFHESDKEEFVSLNLRK